MTGHFIKKYFWNTVCLLCGLFLIGLFIFVGSQDPDAITSVNSGVIFGIIISVFSLISLFLNHGAYFKVQDGCIHAKYHFFGKLQCTVNDIAFVSAQINTVNILFKNGKRCIIMGIENAFALSTFLRRQLFTLEQESPAALQQQLKKLQSQHQKDIFLTIGCCVLLFVNIFIAAFLTDWKEMYQFNTLDWILFAMMGVVEMLTMIATFFIAGRSGKYLLPIQQLQYRINGGTIATQPLPSGNIAAVYTDENYTGRVIICDFPQDEGVYYCVQEFVSPQILKTVHTSEIYQSKEDIDTEELIDISEHFSIIGRVLSPERTES